MKPESRVSAMTDIPVLHSQRLTLRGFLASDAKTVQTLAGDKRIADTTASIPHPYPDGLAEQWIASHQSQWQNRKAMIYAITIKDQAELIGSIAFINLDLTKAQTEIGYWIAVSEWGRGYCSEAAQTLIEFGFKQLNLKRIYAQYLTRNQASAQVLIKLGFKTQSTRMGQCGIQKAVESITTVELIQEVM